MQSLPTNPYIPDQPARDPAKFFGRDDSLAWIASRLAQYAIIAVHGLPRIGASSALLQLDVRLNDQYQTHYIALESQSPLAAMQQVARVVSSAVGLPATDSPQVLRQALGDSIHNTAHKPLLIALDGLAAWELSGKADLLNALGLLTSSDARIRFVLGWGLLEDDTILRDMPLRLIGMTDNLAPIGQLRLGPLTRGQSSELITGTAVGLLKFDFNAVERIWQEANGRPHVLQMLGFAVYERRALSGRVSARDVEQAIDDAVARASSELSEEWQQLTREEQLVLAAGATVRGEHGLLTVGDLVKELASNRLAVSVDDANAALVRLTQLDILETAGVHAYRFSSGLLRDWAIQYANLSAVTGKPVRSFFLPGVGTSSMGARLVRLLSWTLLLAFFGFLALGGASLVQSFGATPTPTLSALQSAPSRTPIPLPTATPLPKVVMAYMFRKTDKDKWRVYVAGPDGIDPTPLTNGLADDQWPSWSPDGSKIAFTSNRDGHYEVYVMNADGSEQTRLTRTNLHSWSPSWSPDGKKIVFSTSRDRNWEVYVMNADGSNPTRLTDDPAEDHAAVWSPDGRVIAFASKRTGNYDIYLMNPDGSAPNRVTQTSANNFSPTWSPDSRRIAFESNRDGNWEIYVMDGDGANAKNLTNTASNDQGPAWSLDGQSLAFFSNREGRSDIWVMRSDGSDARNWTHGAGSAQSPVW
ncbi:MAG: DUF5050 domain-containing protein, partial [Chloroflexota bacterium]